ncbi:hypothetical protein BDV93DRAFT_596773, partial [Ceratobasidium sp. AG-I]
AIDAKHSHRNWEAPRDDITADACDHLVYDYGRRLIMEERGRRKEAQEALQNTQSRLQHEIEATRIAKQELDDANLRYNSLLRQVNIGDNSEESGIVQRFQALNRLIDELSIDFGQQLPDDFLKQFPDTRSCYNKIESQEHLLRTQHAKLLHALSRTGASMDIGEFLGFLFGAIVCQVLHSRVFQPFYPFDGDENDSEKVGRIYSQLRKRAPQMQSAKWRIDTFTTLYDMDMERQSRAKNLASRCEESVTAALQGLFRSRIKLAIGSKLGVIFKDAWELNFYIKAKVAHLGDFETEYFPSDHPYHGSNMQVLDSKPGDPTPSHIFSTCGLGLTITKAVGENKDPESKVVEKATIVSPDIYKQSSSVGHAIRISS